MANLAAALVYSASGLTRIVDGLERVGYARRVIDPKNRRATAVTLTSAGLAALQAAWPTHARGVSKHITSHASTAQARTLATVFRAVIDGLESLPPETSASRKTRRARRSRDVSCRAVCEPSSHRSLPTAPPLFRCRRSDAMMTRKGCAELRTLRGCLGNGADAGLRPAEDGHGRAAEGG